MHLRKRVLVTGGSGFLGSHLCARLLDEGHEVLCVDNFFSSARSNVEELMDNKRFELLRHDVTFPLFVEVDEIYNLACPASPVHYQHDPVQTIKTCVHGAINMLGLAKRLKARIFQASTSEVYGTAQYVPIDEKHPFQGQSPYSATKIGADRLAESFYRSFDLPVTIVRPFNTYGPRQSGRAIIPTIITQLLAGQTEIKLGSLTPTRDFNYVKDTANGFMTIADCDAAIGQELNIATGIEHSIGDLANELIAQINPNAKIVCEAERLRPEKSEVNRLLGDSTKLRELTGWAPQYTFEQGLAATIEFLRGNLDQYKVGQYIL